MLGNLKKIIMLLCLIILTGCGVKYDNDVDTIVYNLNIGTTFKEEIIFTLDSNSDKLADMVDDEPNESFEYLLFKTRDEFFPISNNEYFKYKKIINKDSNKLEAILEYDYLEKEFVYSNYITGCFENYDLISYDEYFEVKVSGEFFCWRDENVEINVKTDYNVIDTNGDKINSNYVWDINKDNYENVSIYYKVSRDYDDQFKKHGNNVAIFGNIKYIIGLILIIVLLFILYKFYKKKKVEIDI